MPLSTFRDLETVVLERDIPERGLRKGDPGAVVELHDRDGLEVEFVRASGKTQALVELNHRYADFQSFLQIDLSY